MWFSKISLAVLVSLTPFTIYGQDDMPFYFWRLGHMDGPHTLSKALGISRDGRTAVGATKVVDFLRAWRCDIDWTTATDDGVPPLYNELFVQEDIGVINPSRPSSAHAASDMTVESCNYSYDKSNLNLDWCGSTVAGTYELGMVSYAVQWLHEVFNSTDEEDFVAIPDFGGGISSMTANDVSADGQIIVGTGNTPRGERAFYVNMANLVDGEPKPQTLIIQDEVTKKTLRSSSAQAVTADGSVIVGYGNTAKGNRAFVSTVLNETNENITLESYVLPNIGKLPAEAHAVTETEDGEVVVAGTVVGPKGPEACIWFFNGTEWTVKNIGSLTKRNKNAVATGIAYRPGSIVGDLMVVGYSNTVQEPSEAFVWTGNPVLDDDGTGYFHRLEYVLTKTGAGEESLMGSTWILTEATGVSAAGDRIVGWGVNPEGGVEAWALTGFPYDELNMTHEE